MITENIKKEKLQRQEVIQRESKGIEQINEVRKEVSKENLIVKVSNVKILD